MSQIHLFFSSGHFQAFDPNSCDGRLSLLERFQTLWKRRAASSLPAMQNPLYCWQWDGCLLYPGQPETLQPLQTPTTPFQVATNSARSAAPNLSIKSHSASLIILVALLCAFSVLSVLEVKTRTAHAIQITGIL